MLTRPEIVGQLRSLQPVRQMSRRRQRAIVLTRKVARIATVTMLGLSFVAGFGAGSMRDAPPRLPAGLRQWALWGDEHVQRSTARTSPRTSFFPVAKRHRVSAYQARQNYLRRQGRVPDRRAGAERY